MNGEAATRSLIDAVLEGLDLGDEEEEVFGAGVERPIRLAVAGRPNVGKSTLINTWLGEERLIAFDLPGTTRSGDVHLARNQSRH